MGPRAIDSFGLEHPQQTSDSETAKISLKNPFGKIAIPADLLRSANDGRVLLYSVARLSDEDLRNPFEVRVQVAVDVLETVFEIGGIVVSDTGKNTVILMTQPPAVQSSDAEGRKEPPKQEKPVSRVYSVGDTVEGFSVYAIGRDSIILEQSEKFVEIARGRPVTVSVPVSAH